MQINRHKLATILAALALVLGLPIALILIGTGIGKATDDDDVRLRFSTIRTSQLSAAQTSFAGVVDPTALSGPAGSAPLLPCLNSCTAVAEQNRAALKTTFDYAAANRLIVYIPPNEYPVARASGQSYGVDITADNLAVLARNVTFRLTGDQTSSAGTMFRVRANHVRIEGATFSLRDATNATSDTVAMTIGDSGTTTVDDVSLVDDQFREGATGSGDYIRMDGGTTTTTISRVTIERCVFDNSVRAAVAVRPGVERLSLSYNFFRSDSRAIYFENTGDGPIGQSTIIGNFIEHNSTNPAVTLAGNGGANVLEQSTFTFNRIIRPIASSTGGGSLYGTALARTRIAYNHITTANASGASIFLEGSVTDVSVTGNFVERLTAASNAAVIKVADDSTSNPTGVIVEANHARQASGSSPGIELDGCVQCKATSNKVTYHASTADSGATGFSGIYVAGTIARSSGIVSRNVIRRLDQDIKASLALSTKTTNDNSVVEFFRNGTEGNGATIAFVGDSGTTAGSKTGTTFAVTVHFRPAFTTVTNVETLLKEGSVHIKTAGTGANVLQSGDAFSAANLAGGLQAGRMLAGVRIVKDGSNTVGTMVLRDNFVDGARTLIYADADGASGFPDGYPLISGNGSVNVTNEFEGGITTWIAESTINAEVIATGACSATKEVTFLTAASNATVTMPDGVRDGQRRCFKVKTATSCAPCTWSPTHFADGTTHTITWTTNTDASWCVVWEAAVPTWRLTSRQSGVTLN